MPHLPGQDEAPNRMDARSQPPDLVHRLRGLRFFDEHFCGHVEALAERIGLVIAIDRVKLTRAFLAWGEDFTSQRTAAAIDRRDFTVFTAGMLLTRLIEMEPVTVAKPPAPVETIEDSTTGSVGPSGAIKEIIAFWPEGFLYTSYCINVLQVVVEQETQQPIPMAAIAEDLRSWWSFRENVREDRWSAIGFFDLFVGKEPNWLFPALAAERPAMRRGLDKTTALP
jgi:hypothetical protein